MRPLFSFVFGLLLASGLFVGGPYAGTSSGVAFAQPDSVSRLGIERAFRAADAGSLLNGATDRVDIIIFGQGASYSRAQAVLVLEDFFRRYPPERVVFEQEVVAEDRRSMIGRYWVTDGGEEAVGIAVRLREKGSEWQLRGIRVSRGGR